MKTQNDINIIQTVISIFTIKNNIVDNKNIAEEINYWYAIYTMPKAEKKVHERFIENNIESYLPLIQTIRVWSDRKKKIYSPLISSYVFVRISETKLNNLYTITGVKGILKYLGKPAKIREFEIENIKILLSDSENITPTNENIFEKGETIRVIKGPFLGLIAQCFDMKGKHRIVVTIESLGSGFEVNVPISFIEKYKPIKK